MRCLTFLAEELAIREKPASTLLRTVRHIPVPAVVRHYILAWCAKESTVVYRYKYRYVTETIERFPVVLLHILHVYILLLFKRSLRDQKEHLRASRPVR